jgi:hypothetical protein
LFEQFGGNRAPTTSVQPLGVYGGSPAMLVAATQTQLFHHGHGPHGHLTSIENGLYVGWPLLLLLVVATVALFFTRRRVGVVVAALALVVAVDFQMYASQWHVLGVTVTAPFRFLQDHIEVARNILPGRFALVMWMAIAWIVAVALDEAVTRARASHLDRRWALAPVAIVLLTLLPLTPGPESPTTPLAVTPKLFTTSLLAKTIPKGATVMIAPMATVGNNAPELWQVRADMRFRQIGGYMLHAVGPKRTASYLPEATTLTTLFRIDLATGLAYKGAVTPAMIRAANRELRASGVSLFMVGFTRRGEARQLEIARQVLGRAPDRRVGGVSIWNL